MHAIRIKLLNLFLEINFRKRRFCETLGKTEIYFLVLFIKCMLKEVRSFCRYKSL